MDTVTFDQLVGLLKKLPPSELPQVFDSIQNWAAAENALQFHFYAQGNMKPYQEAAAQSLRHLLGEEDFAVVIGFCRQGLALTKPGAFFELIGRLRFQLIYTPNVVPN